VIDAADSKNLPGFRPSANESVEFLKSKTTEEQQEVL